MPVAVGKDTLMIVLGSPILLLELLVYEVTVFFDQATVPIIFCGNEKMVNKQSISYMFCFSLCAFSDKKLPAIARTWKEKETMKLPNCLFQPKSLKCTSCSNYNVRTHKKELPSRTWNHHFTSKDFEKSIGQHQINNKWVGITEIPLQLWGWYQTS